MEKRYRKPSDILSILDAISEEQAIDSEYGGDSDADDVLPLPIQNNGESAKTIPIRRSSTKERINTPEGINTQASDFIENSGGDSARNCPRRTTKVLNENIRSDSEDSVDDSDDSCADPDFILDSDIPDGKNPAQRTQSWRLPDSSSSSEDSNGENEHETSEHLDFSWSKTAKDPGVFSTFHYAEKDYGAKSDVDLKSPLKIFEIFLSSAFLTSIVVQSNLFASQKGTDLKMTLEELKAMIGMLIIMGFHTLPSIRLYWSEDENFCVQRIARIMTVKRFLKLLRYIHINDNAQMPPRGSPNFDRLFKIRPMISHLQKCISECFYPSRYLSIDESMVAFKGRCSMKQYMPMKPVKRGFKVWVMACAVTGFVLSFEVYTGRNTEITDSDFGLGEKVVLGLSSMLRGMGYVLFFDNFFSSLPLVRTLLSHRLFSCGTIRSNRKFYPKAELKAERLMRTGDSDYAQAGDISVTKWRDRGKKSVNVVSSLHNPSKTVSVLRTNKTGARESVKCPEPIADYNKFMGGVDRFDQLMAAYSVSWKSRRWWIKLFYYFIEMAIVNSYIMYCETAKKKGTLYLSHLQFRSKLANELIGTFCSRKRTGPSPSAGKACKRNRPDGFPTVENTVRLVNVGMHMPEQTNTRRRCAQCSTKNKEKRSSLICSKCNVALCKGCFAVFHTQP